MHKHSGCCGCHVTHTMARRTFLASVGGSAIGAATLTSGRAAAEQPATASSADRARPAVEKKSLVVQPVLLFSLHTPQNAVSWRPWGGLHSQSDVDQEANRIGAELADLAKQAEFPMTFRDVAKVTKMEEANALRQGDADVMLVYAAMGGGDVLEALLSPDRNNLVFVRHKSGPVSLWYEIISPVFMRKAGDELAQPGLTPYDVVVDQYPDLLWRLRALYALKNTVGSRIVAFGGASGWGAGGKQSPQAARDLFKLDIQEVTYDDLGKRIAAAFADPLRMQQAEADANAYLQDPNVTLETDKGFVVRGFLLTQVFEEMMAEAKAHAMTINNCMTTIMPLSQTTACLPLSLINDSGALAFCESDFAVIPSGILLHHICSMPVFLQDPTYPHDGIITVAHCTAPRRMDGKNLEKVRMLTHYESDFGAAPKVDMRIGQVITMIDPDFGNKRWIGFRGTVIENPFLDICRSQTDVTIEGDWRKLMADMGGFHWMLAYGDHLRETGYALRKLGIGWYNLTADRTIEA